MTDPIARLNAALEGRYRIERQLGEGGRAPAPRMRQQMARIPNRGESCSLFVLQMDTLPWFLRMPQLQGPPMALGLT